MNTEKIGYFLVHTSRYIVITRGPLGHGPDRSPEPEDFNEYELTDLL